MKKVSIFAATISLAMLLNGCQSADDSNASDEKQGDENAVAMNDGGSQGSSETGDEGAGSGSESGEADATPGLDDPGGAGLGDTPGLDDPEGAGLGDTPGLGDDPEGAGLGDTPGLGDDPGGVGLGDALGAEGGAGGLGAGPGGQGGGSGGIPTFKEGTAENAVIQIWMAIKNGEQKGLAEFISLRAKGDIAELRNGKLASKKLDELKQQMARIKLKTRTSGTTKTISLQNEEGRIFRFTCRREDGKYLVQKFENKAPSKRKRRGR